MPVVCAPVIKFTVAPGPSTGQSSLQNSNLITPAFESGTKDGGEKERQSFHLSHHNWSAQTTKSVSLDFGKGRRANEALANEDVTRITSSILSLPSANAPSALNYLLAANSTCGMHSTEFRHVTSILMNRNHRSNTTGTESVLMPFNE
ncbi:hypothetical protein G5I_09628 [Acromyrmex echinatior]|uniref:Uncharacterized protein n=1 Tax=Acromyrmex echinatior TaxID=103372 RepID=F4WUQ1_ACREC|nr:hypothetical protein G5I_09628 [Acromyrmex echinatior]